MVRVSRRCLFAGGASLFLASGSAGAQTGPQPLLIYVDKLLNDWTSIGWAQAELEAALQDQEPVRLTMPAWSTFGFRAPQPIEAGSFSTLTLMVHGGDEGRQRVNLRLKSGESEHKSVELRLRPAVWERCDLDLQRHLGIRSGDSFDTIELFNPGSEDLPSFFVNLVLLT